MWKALFTGTGIATMLAVVVHIYGDWKNPQTWAEGISALLVIVRGRQAVQKAIEAPAAATAATSDASVK